MHPDRSGPPNARAWSPGRVIGLGAPVTVVIRAPRSDVPLLRGEVTRRLNEHDRNEPVIELHRRRARDDHDEWRAQRTAWTDMLGQIDDERDADVALVWPTAYAAPVLHGAVVAAEAAVKTAPRGTATRQALGAALESARVTLSDFLAVDNGGLAEVYL